MALPGSPLHRCGVSCAPRRRTKAPPTPIPRTPSAGNTTSAEGSWEDFDAVQPCRRARPEAEEEKGGSAARSDEAGGRGASASGFVEVVFAACVGSALDLDHFVAAGSLRLSRATGLAERPWGHCVAALVVAVREERSWKQSCKRSCRMRSELWEGGLYLLVSQCSLSE